MTAHGLPDNQKSSRIMLKDYVKVCVRVRGLRLRQLGPNSHALFYGAVRSRCFGR